MPLQERIKLAQTKLESGKKQEKEKQKEPPKKAGGNPELLTIFAKNTRSVGILLNTSKGRDKFCQLIQYICNFYITCMKSSDVYGELVKAKKVRSVVKMKSMENNISQGRKIFRLLKFLDEFEELH